MLGTAKGRCQTSDADKDKPRNPHRPTSFHPAQLQPYPHRPTHPTPDLPPTPFTTNLQAHAPPHLPAPPGCCGRKGNTGGDFSLLLPVVPFSEPSPLSPRPHLNVFSVDSACATRFDPLFTAENPRLIPDDPPRFNGLPSPPLRLLSKEEPLLCRARPYPTSPDSKLPRLTTPSPTGPGAGYYISRLSAGTIALSTPPRPAATSN